MAGFGPNMKTAFFLSGERGNNDLSQKGFSAKWTKIHRHLANSQR
jgi:hypothetical protein